MKAGRFIYSIAALCVVGAVVYFTQYFDWGREPEPEPLILTPFQDTTLFCAFELKAHDDSTREFISGYAYHMLSRFEKDLSLDLEIRYVLDTLNWVDSLRRGSWDMAVIPMADAVELDSIIYSQPLDSIAVCAAGLCRADVIEAVNEWLPTYYASSGYKAYRSLFMRPYNPVRILESGRTVTYISPYDDLIKKYAQHIGWDWRMLAALIFSESHFDISVRSRAGAEGLMQMIPSTARSFGVDNPLDPEDNIRAGAEYLMKLQRHMSNKAANAIELHKMTLASYNAGEGRIIDCINFAGLMDMPSDTWDAIVDAIRVMNEMDDEQIAQMDTLKFGRFIGAETISYVESVLSVYRAFCAMKPDSATFHSTAFLQSEQDPLETQSESGSEEES